LSAARLKLPASTTCANNINGIQPRHCGVLVDQSFHWWKADVHWHVFCRVPGIHTVIATKDHGALAVQRAIDSARAEMDRWVPRQASV